VGLVQRLMLLPFFAWIALVAQRAYRAPNDASVTATGNEASRALS